MDMKKKFLKIGFGALTALLLVCLLILLGQRNAFLAELECNAGEYDPRSIVLRNTNPAQAERLAARYGAELRLTPEGTYGRLTLPEGAHIQDVVRRWGSLFRLGMLSPDYRVVTAWELAKPQYPVTDSDYSRQTYLDYLHLENLWETHRGQGITVAVIDTGIDTDHPEFAGRIRVDSYNATEDKTVEEYGWAVIEDEQGHGTASSGVIAAAMDGVGTVGIAPEAELLVIKAQCDSQGNFQRASDLVFGLYYAISRNVRVINMSFGFATAGEDPFAEAVRLAWDSDILCVAAACNRGTDTPTWPAANESVLGVGAINEDWNPAAYSNYGPNVDLVAPGTVFTTQMGGGYGTMEGTSFACPMVSGSLALLLQQEGPYAAAEDLWQILLASCRDLGTPGRDERYGFGVPDVSALVQGQRGTVTFDLGDTEETVTFLPEIPVQNVPQGDDLAGWFFDESLTRPWEPFREVFTEDLTLYAKWEEKGESPYTYEILDDGTVKILSYGGRESVLSVPETLDGRAVSTIGPYAFGNPELRRVELPASVENLDGSAFFGAVSLEYIGISSENTDFVEKDGVLFNASGKVLVAYPAGRSGHYTVPKGTNEIGDGAFAGSKLETVDMTGVRTLGSGAFRESDLTELDIPDSVTRVWSDAFRGCGMLVSVRMGSGLKSTGSGMFAECTALKTVTVPEGIRTVSDETFAGSGLEQVIFAGKSQLGRIGEKAFYGCGSLAEISLPEGVKTLGQQAFWGCCLKTVTVPASVTEIGSGAFGLCAYLEALAVAPGNEAYGILDGVLLTAEGELLHTFPAGKNLESYTLPDTVREIAPFGFAGTGKLGTLVIPQGFETLSEDALREGGFEKLVLPDSLRNIGSYALAGCALQELTVPARVSALGLYAFAGSALETVTFEEGSLLETLPAYLVTGCENLRTVTFGPGSALRFIQAHGLEGAGNLTGVDFGDAGLLEIGNYAFRGCGKLKAPVLPETLKSIGRNAFDGCPNLGVLTLPEGLEYMGSVLILPGDADGNGKLSYNDALIVLRCSIGLAELSPEVKQACDMDGNGKLTYNDALVILRKSIGL